MNRAKVLNAVRLGLLAVVLIGVAYALWRNWGSFSRELRQLDWSTVVAGGVIGFTAPALTMLGWRALLADLGTRLPLAPAASVFFVGQLGKYVPGSVWTVVVQTEMGHRLRVPRRRMAAAGLVMLALSVLGGAIVALPAVPLLLTASQTRLSAGGVVMGVLALVTVLAVISPPVLNALIARGLRLIRREPLEHDLSGGAILRCMGYIVAAWLATGASTLVLARPLASDDDWSALVVVCISGFAFASVAGMVAVVLPAGVGVREGILILILSSVMTPAAATAVVVVTRFLSVVSDVVWAGVGWLWARAHHLLPSSQPGATAPDATPGVADD